jgi:predicted transcriptional regulator
MEAEKLHAKPAKASPLTLLDILSHQSKQSLALFEVQAQSGMEPSRYGDALKSLLSAGYIGIEGAGLEQVVRLTPSGAEIVRLAKPA